jgi:hypothetical protein
MGAYTSAGETTRHWGSSKRDIQVVNNTKDDSITLKTYDRKVEPLIDQEWERPEHEVLLRD